MAGKGRPSNQDQLKNRLQKVTVEWALSSGAYEDWLNTLHAAGRSPKPGDKDIYPASVRAGAARTGIELITKFIDGADMVGGSSLLKELESQEKEDED